ncbi:HD domain-containing phosphohydrolase [Anaeroselena agilis]|uniref:Diguanylate cyclase n=1 Tax=Anaeroselena agilis TaxID=3063788 RepID=A0ABU3P4I4_9FIRM|nr:diguanylate cyclase [Selenomonadales bacterium 4137-cl]
MAAVKRSLRSLIIISFIALMVATIGLIGYFAFANWHSSTERMVSELQNNTNRVILSRIEGFISATEHVNGANRNLVGRKVIAMGDRRERAQYFASVLQATDEDVYSFTYGMENGEFYGARRNARGEIEVYENNAATGGRTRYYATTPGLETGSFVNETGLFDPRTRDWYKIAKTTGRPVFSPIYKHFVMDDLAISAACPIYGRDGALAGVLGTHITLSRLNGFLREAVQDQHAIAYIVEKDSGYLVANSLGRPNFSSRWDGIGRVALGEGDNPAVVAAWRRSLAAPGAAAPTSPDKDGLLVKVTGYNRDGLNWLIITAIPQEPFMAGFEKSLRFSLLIAALAIVLAVLIYAKSTAIVFRPVYDLIRTTERFSAGDFSERAQVVRKDEIGRLSLAFNRMADQIDALIHTLEERIAERTRELQETVRQLRDSEDDIRLLLDSTAEAIYGIDLDGNCTFCNASCLRMLKYDSQEELIGKNVHNQLHARCSDDTPITAEECRILQTLRSGERVHATDEVFWRSDGTFFPVEYFSYPQYRDGRVVGVVVTFFDISERKKSEAEVAYLSHHDQLTGLYNRRFYEGELLRLDTPDNLPMTIVVADVNGLKLVNDSLGHTVGDELLVKAAAALSRGCRSSDLVARLGGDEFVILLPRTTPAAAERIIRRIKNIAARETVGSVTVSLSFGYGTKMAAEEDIEEVFKKADDQMYRNKLFESPDILGKTIDTLIKNLHENNAMEESHSRRVADLCRRMGEALGLAPGDVDELGNLGLLHDIGKIAVADDILSKPGKLTDDEWAVVKRHSEIGYRILSTVNHLSELADYVLAHHERWDGGGYPKGLRGAEIPLPARIIHIADAYEAMTGYRSYRPTMTEEAAVAELQQGAGRQFDPALVEIFVEKVLGKPA